MDLTTKEKSFGGNLKIDISDIPYLKKI